MVMLDNPNSYFIKKAGGKRVVLKQSLKTAVQYLNTSKEKTRINFFLINEINERMWRKRKLEMGSYSLY